MTLPEKNLVVFSQMFLPNVYVTWWTFIVRCQFHSFTDVMSYWSVFPRMVSDRHDRPPGAELQGRCANCMRVILCHTPRLHCTVLCDKHHSLTERTLSPEHHISITANGVHLSLIARILTAWGHFALKKRGWTVFVVWVKNWGTALLGLQSLAFLKLATAAASDAAKVWKHMTYMSDAIESVVHGENGQTECVLTSEW